MKLQFIVKRFVRSKILNFGRWLLRLIEEDDWKNIKYQFKKIGTDSYIPSPRRIFNPQYISIGNNFSCLNDTRIEAISEYYGEAFNPMISIGNNVNMSANCHIGCIDKIIIGDNVLIASRVYISDHNHGFIDERDVNVAPALRPLSSRGAVIIERNVWIGEGVSILPGVVVGENSIIGANSVVTRSVPKNSVVAGIPAKVIRSLI